MTETFEPLEQREAHEKMREAHEHGGEMAPWIRQLAVATALYAVFAAFSGLVANKLAEEALLTKTEASISRTEAAISQNEAADWWAYFQAKSIKEDVLKGEALTLKQTGAPVGIIAPVEEKAKGEVAKKEDGEKRARAAEKERDQHMAESRKHDEESKLNSRRHTNFAGAVTLFQVAIGLAAIAVLTRLRWAFAGSIVLGAAGLLAMLWGGFQLLQKTHA